MAVEGVGMKKEWEKQTKVSRGSLLCYITIRNINSCTPGGL